MKLLTIISLLYAPVFALLSPGDERSFTVALLPTSLNPTRPIAFATIALNSSSLNARITSYEQPEPTELFSVDTFSDDKPKSLRIGIYDASRETWTSSTSLTSAKAFSKGYSPTLIINTDADGTPISVTLKSHRIDAGQTRDFEPKIKVIKMKAGPRPDLNKPVILIEGKIEEQAPEKSFLQKYWWVLLAGLMLIVSAGGDSE